MNAGELFPNLMAGVLTVGVRFDIDKLDSGFYGKKAWKIIWQEFEPLELRKSLLFEGDTLATPQGENVFCIAIQRLDPDLIEKVQSALSQNPEFKAVAATPAFVEGHDCLAGLPSAGQIDGSGELVGQDAAIARMALGEVRLERRESASAPPDPLEKASRIKPASSRTAKLADYSSFESLVSYSGGVFEDHVRSPLMPEELCDVIERYADLVEVQVHEYSCPVSEAMLRVNLYPKGQSDKRGKSFIGMYSFGSHAEAVKDCRSRCGSDAPAEVVNDLVRNRGIVGKWHLNFESHGGAEPESYDKKKVVPPQDLWAWLFRRREALAIPLPSTTDSRAGGLPGTGSSPTAEESGGSAIVSALLVDQALGELQRRSAEREGAGAASTKPRAAESTARTAGSRPEGKSWLSRFLDRFRRRD